MIQFDPGAEPTLPWASGRYSLKRHGVTITNRESGPIRTPGCVQHHGALLVLDSADLTILQAAENSGEILGRSPDRLLGWGVELVLGPEAPRPGFPGVQAAPRPRRVRGRHGRGPGHRPQDVERHGGRIWVESTPGEGSSFFITFSRDEGGDHAVRF